MCIMQIEEGIIIDAVENVVEAIEELNGMRIDDYEVIKKFILEENATKFYIDEKLNSYMEPHSSAIYVWLDTGFVDKSGNPILVALQKGYDGYVGHITDTSKNMINRLKNRHSRNSRHIRNNAGRFLNKYNNKLDSRKVRHITDIKQYIASCDEEEILNVHWAVQLHEISKELLSDDTVSEEDLIENQSDVAEDKKETEIAAEDEKLEKMQRDITVGMLMDHISELNKEIDRLVEIIDECKKDKEYIEELRDRENELKQAFVNIRLFNEEQKSEMDARDAEKYDNKKLGHNLLNGRKKILVLGDSQVSEKDMLGIATNVYGFAKKDIEFYTDYEKITNAAGRFQQAERYAAVILGAMPHKVSKLGCWNSIASKFATEGFGPITVEAHNNSGWLVINKESYRKALDEIVEKLAG